MSARLDNTLEEVEFLEGATVRDVRIGDMDGEECIEIDFKLPAPVDGFTLLTYQVWQDGEGNGPGYLALTGYDK